MSARQFFALCFVLSIALPATGQVVIRRGDSTMVVKQMMDVEFIPELHAGIASAERGIRVDHVMPAPEGGRAGARVDIREGDMILAVDGKRIKKLADFMPLYRGAAVGNEIKLGIERAGQMMIVPFTKADPKDLPKGARMIIRTEGGPDNVRPIPEIGALFGFKEGKVIVTSVLSLPEKAKGLPAFQEGDIVRSVNGTTVPTLKEFSTVYDGVATGASVAFTVHRTGKEQTLTFTKPESSGRVIIRKRVE